MRALGFDAKKAEVLKLLKDHDKDGRGLMEFDDFQRIMTQKILDRDPVEEIKKAFQLFDDDGTGKISLKNLRRVAKELGEDIDDEELQAMIDEFDLDNDGESKCCFGYGVLLMRQYGSHTAHSMERSQRAGIHCHHDRVQYLKHLPKKLYLFYCL